MGAILKSHRYRLVDNNDFDLPLPLKFQVYKKDCPIAEYEISETEELTCRILTKYKEDMLTTVYRPIKLSDIYYLLSCRVFQNNTPFTAIELSLLGLDKYNVYEILKITHGITPFDDYWIRFDGDECDYDKALDDFNSVTAPKEVTSSDSDDITDAKESLGQHNPNKTKIDADEGTTAKADSENITDVDIDRILHNEGGKMSQGDIERLLADAAAEPASEPKPAPEPAASSDGKMSQDDIEKLLAGAAAEPEPAPAPEPAASSGGKMSQDDIEKLLAGAAAEPEPASAPEPAVSSSGKMSEEDIAALLQSMQDEANK